MASSSNQTYEYGSLSISQRLLQQKQEGGDDARELSDGSTFPSGASSTSSSSTASSSSDTSFKGSNAHATGSDTHIPLLHFLCQNFPTSKDIIHSTLMQDVTEARRPATLPAATNTDLSTSSAGGTTVGGGFRVNVSISADTVAKLLHVSESQVVRLLRGINYTKSKKGRSKHHLSRRKPRIKATVKTHKTMTAGKLDFQYPINIAINNEAPADVVEVLAKAAPGILLKPEETSGHNSLFIALHKQPQNRALIRVLLQCTPQLAFGKDPRGNTPLHWAIQRGYYCSLPVIQALYQANPKAVLQANYNGDTPFQIAQRSALVKEDVVDFLQLCHDQCALGSFEVDNDESDIFVIATKKKTTIALYDMNDVRDLPVEGNWLEDLF